MLKYVLPVLIGYTGGKMIAGDRGSVIGAIATVGIVVGAGDTTMLIGGMIMGPLAGWVIKKFDELVDGKMRMLIGNKEESKITHGFTMKFIPSDKARKKDPNFKHDRHYGLPISFTKNDKNWYVNLGKSNISEAKKIQASLDKKEKEFITSVVNDIGDDIIDYWNIKNVDTDKGKKKLDDIVRGIEDKYYEK